MTVQEHLEELRKTTFGCGLTAYGDLSSGLILRSSSEAPYPREMLDALCDDAVRSLAVTKRQHWPAGMETDGYGTSVISFTTRRSHVFVRHDPKADDLICATIDKAQAIAPVLRAARATAEQIAEDST